MASDQSNNAQQEKRNVLGNFLPFFLMLCTGVSISSIDMYLPALPELAQYFNTTDNMLRISVMISPFVSAFTGLFYGTLSDQYGRRPIILFCLLMFSLGSLWCAFSSSATEFLTARIVQALGSTGMGLQTITVLSDKFRGLTLARYLSVYSVLYPVTFALAPNVGAFLMLYTSWHGMFYLLASLGAGLMIFMYNALPETIVTRSSSSNNLSISVWCATILTMFRTKPIFRHMALTNALAVVMNNIFVTNAPFMFEQHFELTRTQFANISVIPNSFNIIGCLYYSFLLRSRTPKFCINVGRVVTLLFMAIALIALCVPSLLGVASVVVIYCLCAFGMSFLTMTSVGFAVSDMQTDKGLGNGIIQFVRNISSSSAVMLFGYFCSGSVEQVFFAMSMCALGVLLTVSNCYNRLPDLT
ncbi:MAG: MFS transporter [Holosporales bacterium]|jgi:DHA1 family bicyclomycin/chloramphenicol resistance-like MFS transporter|nr:MFS transporter [Holosporales bacterium]